MSDVKIEDDIIIVDFSEPSRVDFFEPSTCEKRKREVVLRSRAWNHFTKLEKKPNGRDECVCNHCKKIFSCASRGGTGHLLRHIDEGRCPCYRNGKGNKSLTLTRFVQGSLGQGSTFVPWKIDRELPQTPTQHSNHAQNQLIPEEYPTFDTMPDDNEGQSTGSPLPQECTLKSRPREQPWKYEMDGLIGKLIDLTNESIPSEYSTKACEVIRTCIDQLVDLVNGRIPKEISSKSCESVSAHDYSISAAVKCLNEMEDIPQSSSMYLDAFEILKDAEEREAFICLNPEPRRRWLQRMLNRHYPSLYTYSI